MQTVVIFTLIEPQLTVSALSDKINAKYHSSALDWVSHREVRHIHTWLMVWCTNRTVSDRRSGIEHESPGVLMTLSWFRFHIMSESFMYLQCSSTVVGVKLLKATVYYRQTKQTKTSVQESRLWTKCSDLIICASLVDSESLLSWPEFTATVRRKKSKQERGMNLFFLIRC